MNKLITLLLIFLTCGCDATDSFHEQYREAIRQKDCSIISTYTSTGPIACEINLLNQTLQELLKAQKGK